VRILRCARVLVPRACVQWATTVCVILCLLFGRAVVNPCMCCVRLWRGCLVVIAKNDWKICVHWFWFWYMRFCMCCLWHRICGLVNFSVLKIGLPPGVRVWFCFIGLWFVTFPQELWADYDEVIRKQNGGIGCCVDWDEFGSDRLWTLSDIRIENK